MESDGEDLENVFENYENSGNDNGAEETEDAQTTNETSRTKISVPKRIVKNPRLKFNPERLCGERGIPVLVEHFKNVKFKGPGHETEDLDKLLSKLEHWTHRLFPSMKFADCLHHIEKLGRKRPVQTCLRKIRLDMPILSSDFVNDDDDDNVQRVDDSEPVEVDAFDRLIGESQDILNASVPTVENTADSNSLHFSTMQDISGMGHILGSASGSSLTEEQKERMERNRMLAAERRKSRLTALQQSSTESQSTSVEITASQENSNKHDSFDSLFRNQENIQNNPDDSVMELGHDNENVIDNSSDLNNQSLENLGLDDLINLVNEEEPVSDKNSAVSSSEQLKTFCSDIDKSDVFSQGGTKQITLSNSKQNIDINISGNNDSQLETLCKLSETSNEENCGIETLLDLVNENSEAS